MSRIALIAAVAAALVLPAMTARAAAGDADNDTISDVDEGMSYGRDTDKDGVPDYLDSDSDGDGIPDAIEAGDASLSTPPRDTDKDGLPDYRDVDSDNDGLPDAVEDANGDGLVGLDETSATQADTDGDGLPDGMEDTNFNGQVDPGEADPRNPDSDGDGLKDGADDCPTQAEDFDGLLDSDGCPELDADEDGVLDTVEQGHACLKALVADSDGDGLKDGEEDKNGNGKVDPGESDPCNVDTDGDGFKDNEDDCPTEPEDFDGDRDRDGCPDTGTPVDYGVVEGGMKPDAGIDGGGEADRDGDGIPDSVEDGHRCLDPDRADSDGDGASDGEEDLNKNGKFEREEGETDPCTSDIDPVGGPRCDVGARAGGPPIVLLLLLGALILRRRAARL